MKFPEEFEKRMKEMLGEEEYRDFLKSYGRPRRRGLRVNRLKISPEEFEDVAGTFPETFGSNIERIPWTEDGFYVPEECYPARHPYYAAGLYYLQEPSAMRPAEVLPVSGNDRVLDLCAAPGGKATELAVKLALAGNGILVANEIHPARARALLRNLELTGARNYCVLNETPERLAAAFPGWFDKILVDAPCSGEGMFRKEEEALSMWSLERVRECAARQKMILEQAYAMLRPGGLLLYSTCTFSGEEDEERIEELVQMHPDMRVMQQERLWPHQVEGEGHFLSLLEKKQNIFSGESGNYDRTDGEGGGLASESERAEKTSAIKKENGRKEKKQHGPEKQRHPDREQMRLLGTFFQNMKTGSGLTGLKREDIEVWQNRAYLPAMETERVSGLHILRNGLYLGEWKKNRFEPSQALALSLKESSYKQEWHLGTADNSVRPETHPGTQNRRPDSDESMLIRFLQGESLSAPDLPDGWTLVYAGTYPVGWGKVSGGILKNRLPAAWRQQKR